MLHPSDRVEGHTPKTEAAGCCLYTYLPASLYGVIPFIHIYILTMLQKY